MSDIYRTKLCRPDKGDFGEAAVALYLLFCGDELRKEVGADYNTFSVALIDWLSYLELAAGKSEDDEPMEDVDLKSSGRNSDVPEESATPTSAETASVSMGGVDHNAPACTINCIQFYRHSLRIGFEKYKSRDFLEWLYKSAC